ncbi:hypothetical protein AA101099_1880 [Neoasaia chiangmaiensis NBRC 101099]|uniref:Uncharacterized protein n=1 Tax=Neoasaia chiangmaiensis TaxID=320497 RepID=A0A1U9KR06_9PROT|nr:hypothetical protein [Neoasaia chiangmaiensis]AQS88177.1 hypothetical protein A0U93_09755 [Neoasaia chiangmaiensis]GBR39927.1 hypothetical protein AA101099_1880 [Neoasaia chiangmaiensis NBRC 101099]GEN14804.1 hypothetical protein NCH01_12350 [Neoasaia chiangmaiensis]
MSRKFIRTCSLVAANGNGGTVDLSQLRITFSVVHGVVSTPKTLRARVYNLSDDSAALIKAQYNKAVSLSVGYNGKSDLLFSGDIRQFRFGRESPVDTYLDILAVTNDDWYAEAGMNQSLAEGWTHADVAHAIAQAASDDGITVGTIPAVPGSGGRPKVIYGHARDALRTVAANVSAFGRCDGSTINFFQPAKKSASSNATSAIHLSPTTGLVGIPMQTEGGVQATCLLDPRMVPDAVVAIYSRNDTGHKTTIAQEEVDPGVGVNGGNYTVNADGTASVAGLSATGQYRVAYAEHMGDTRGNDWLTTIMAIDVDSSAVTSQAAISATS